MIKYIGKKCTANEFAKLIVCDKGHLAEYWQDCEYDTKGFTDRELRLCDEAIDKQIRRVRKFLGIREIWNKIK